MKAPADKRTGELLPEHDLAGERPRNPSKGAQRLARMRERRGLKAITVNLPAELVDAFHAKRKQQGKTANAVIEKLIKSQYLRDR